MDLIEIKQLTDKLLNYNQQFVKLYQEGRQKEITRDFETVIKPFVNEVKILNEQWKEKMVIWLQYENVRHLHLNQIDTISTHIEQQSVQSFFPETSRTRFLNANRAVEYFLEEILKEIKKRDAGCISD